MDKSNKPFETEEKGVGLCPDCAVETGTIFDGTDRTAAVSRLFETEQAAAGARSRKRTLPHRQPYRS